MFTLCACGNTDTAQKINGFMDKADPDGSHQAEDDPDKVLGLLGSAAPDIVWLDADKEGLSVAEKGREILPKANFIFSLRGQSTRRRR